MGRVNINPSGEIDHTYQSSNVSRWYHYKNTSSYGINSNSIFIDDKMISDKTDTKLQRGQGIDWGYMSITRAEGMEHGCISVEQQALLGRQSATATVGNEVGAV